MEYTTLNNGIKMPMVDFGVFQIPDPERVRQNFDIFDFELTADDMAKIAAINTDTTVYADHHAAQTIENLAGYIGKSY